MEPDGEWTCMKAVGFRRRVITSGALGVASAAGERRPNRVDALFCGKGKRGNYGWVDANLQQAAASPSTRVRVVLLHCCEFRHGIWGRIHQANRRGFPNRFL